MPINLTPDGSVYPDEFIAPDEGDLVTGASVQQTAQPLLNGLEFVKDSLETTQAKIYGLGSTKYYYFDAIPLVAVGALGGGAPDYDILANVLGGSGPSLYSSLAVANTYTPYSLARLGNFEGKFKDVYVRLRGASGHSALPENMPLIQVTRTNPDGTSTSVVSQVDTTAVLGSYESWHYVSCLVGDTLHSGSIGGDPRGYTLWIRSEHGANAVAGLEIGYIVCGVEGE